MASTVFVNMVNSDRVVVVKRHLLTITSLLFNCVFNRRYLPGIYGPVLTAAVRVPCVSLQMD